MAATMVSEEPTTICTHCDRSVPASNADLHYAHCSRNLDKCKVCGDMVPRKHAEEHYLTTHAPVSCSLCSETVQRETLDVHKGENCPKRMVICEYCELPLPAIDLFEHQDFCGSRTEMCYLCRRYVRLRDRYAHETTCNGVQDEVVGTSRNEAAVERDHRRPQRRRELPFARRHFLLTIAFTGIAVILGSFFYQKKAASNE
ncbi:TRAF-type zinc finger domain-containing protein [Drosera capensis]